MGSTDTEVRINAAETSSVPPQALDAGSGETTTAEGSSRAGDPGLELRRRISAEMQAERVDFPRPNSRTLPAWPVALAAGALIAMGVVMRCSLAAGLTWQIDELPLIQRLTGLAGKVGNEAEAAAFVPSLYTLRHGAVRSMRAPRHPLSPHPTSAFWSNITMHLFGVTPLAARLMPLVFSLATAAIAAWLVLLARGGRVAAWLAAGVTALSPLLTIYGAQVRGYAETAALAGLLLVSLEHYRHRPASIARGLCVFIVGLGAAVSVYTTWMYWVLPVLLVAVMVLPRAAASPEDRRRLRRGAISIAAALVAVMAIYTYQRRTTWALQMTVGARDIQDAERVFAFLIQTAAGLFAWSGAILLAAGIGAFVLYRRQERWWLAAIGLGLLVPFAFGVLSGNVGFVRTFMYLPVPIAALAGMGFEWALRALALRVRPLVISVSAALVLATSALAAHSTIERRARQLIEPDWGAMLAEIDAQPPGAGPRWVCPSVTYHWVLTWYRTPSAFSAVLELDPGETAEIVLGSRVRADGRETVYREDHARDCVAEAPLPRMLNGVPPWRTIAGIAVRRFQGRRVLQAEIGAAGGDGPVWVLVPAECTPSAAEWADYVREAWNAKRELMTFKPVISSRGVLRSLLVPAMEVHRLDERLKGWGSECAEQARWFELEPLALEGK
ncbi:MAG: hypothetical protein J5J06_20225 [Phycisphaerae bacterium]|nr:hypothetical protein [Phycisphaerae bacterium]